MAIETTFAIGYAICAMLAVLAHVARRVAGRNTVGSFWSRVAVVMGIFAILRYISAQVFVAAAVRDVSHEQIFHNGLRPGQFVMLLCLIVVGVTLAGLFFFKARQLPKSMLVAAFALAILILLAVAHSAALYLTGAILQAKFGNVTISRYIEAAALLVLAASSLAFARGSKGMVPPG